MEEFNVMPKMEVLSRRKISRSTSLVSFAAYYTNHTISFFHVIDIPAGYGSEYSIVGDTAAIPTVTLKDNDSRTFTSCPPAVGIDCIGFP